MHPLPKRKNPYEMSINMPELLFETEKSMGEEHHPDEQLFAIFPALGMPKGPPLDSGDPFGEGLGRKETGNTTLLEDLPVPMSFEPPSPWWTRDFNPKGSSIS